jgi:amino acid adenylation domain-containing protein
MSEKDRRIATLLRGDQTEIACQSVINLFEDQVRATPDLLAVKQGSTELSYQQFASRVKKLSDYIRQVPRRTNRICIIMENSADAVATVYAVLKAGATYVPLGLENGICRNREIILDCQPDMVLFSAKSMQKICSDPDGADLIFLLSGQGRVRNVEDILARKGIESTPCPMAEYAYVIYTSGSTGKSKGVMVTHQNLLNYLLWAREQYIGGRRSLNLALFTSMAFDLTVTSLFLPLISGNTIVIYDSSNSGYALSKIIRDNCVDIVKLTPTHLRIIMEMKVSESRLRTLIVGGEALKASVARKIDELFPSKVAIYNEYGPTEATVGCMIYRYVSDKDVEGGVPIGVPIHNTNIYILDELLQPVGHGEIGEIYISGHSVAAGYLHRDELTKSRFLPERYSDFVSMYKTNDLAVLREDGMVVFVGRSDQQIKLRGYRIELEEIESKISNVYGVKDVAVVLIQGEEFDSYICAYIVCEQACDIERIKIYLSGILPPYMLPSVYRRVDCLPLTANGKTNRRALENLNS